MGAITWKNIDIGDNRAANSLLVNSTNQLTDSLDKLSDLASQQGEIQAKNWDTKAGQNTADALAKVRGISDIKVLEDAMKSGLNTDAFDQQYGKQYDKSIIATALESKQKELQNKSIAEADRLRNMARQDEGDRLAREDAARKKAESEAVIREREAALKANLLRQQEAALNLSMAKHDNALKMQNERYSHLLNVFKVEALEGSNSAEEAISTFKNKAYEFVKESEGTFSAADADSLIASFSTVAKSRGLDQSHYIKENAIQTAGYNNALEKLTKEHETIRTTMQKHFEYDPGIAKLQADPQSEADAQLEVAKLLGGKDLGKYDENQITEAFTNVRRAFRVQGLEPSPALIRDVIISSGWEQEWFNMADAMPDENKSIINSYANKLRRTNDYLTGAASGSVKEMEQTMKRQLASLQQDFTVHSTKLAADAFRDSNDKDARFSSIGEYVDATEIERPTWGAKTESMVTALKAGYKELINSAGVEEDIAKERQSTKALEDKLKPKDNRNPRGVKSSKQ